MKSQLDRRGLREFRWASEAAEIGIKCSLKKTAHGFNDRFIEFNGGVPPCVLAVRTAGSVFFSGFFEILRSFIRSLDGRQHRKELAERQIGGARHDFSF